MIDRFRTLIKDSLLKRLFKNTGILFSGTLISNALGFLSLALTTRALGATQFGILVLVSTYITIIDRLVNFQSWQAFIKYGAEYQEGNDEKSFKGLIKVGTLIDLTSAVAGIFLAFLLAPIIGNFLDWSADTVQLAQMYSITIIFNLDGVPIGVLRLFDRFTMFSVQKVITALFKVIAVGWAFYLGLGLYGFVWIWIISAIVRHLVLFGFGHWILAKSKIKNWWQGSLSEWKEVLKFTIWTNMKSTFDLPVQQFDIMLVSAIISVEATGVYKIIKKVGSIMTKVATPVYQAIFPDFSIQIANNNISEAISYSKKVGLLLFSLSLPIAIIIGATGEIWFPYIFDLEIEEWLYAMISFFIIKSFAAGFITIHPLFVAFGLVKYDALITLLSNCLYFIIAYLGGLYFGLTGVVVALAIQIFVLVFAKIKIINRKLEYPFLFSR